MNISNSSSCLKSKMFRMTVIFQTAVGVGGVNVGALAKPTGDSPPHAAGVMAEKGKKFDVRQWNRASASTSVKMESFMGFNIRQCMAEFLKRDDKELLESVESHKLTPDWSGSQGPSGLISIGPSSLRAYFQAFYNAETVRFTEGDYVFWRANDDDGDDGSVLWGKVSGVFNDVNILHIQFGDRVTFFLYNQAYDDGSLFTADEAKRYASGPGWFGLYQAIYESGVKELEWLLSRASAEIIY